MLELWATLKVIEWFIGMAFVVGILGWFCWSVFKDTRKKKK
jgi:hypothetical protein